MSVPPNLSVSDAESTIRVHDALGLSATLLRSFAAEAGCAADLWIQDANDSPLRLLLRQPGPDDTAAVQPPGPEPEASFPPDAPGASLTPLADHDEVLGVLVAYPRPAAGSTVMHDVVPSSHVVAALACALRSARQQREIRVLRARLAGASNRLAAATIIATDGGRVVDADDGAHALLGKADLVDVTLHDLVHPDDSAVTGALLAAPASPTEHLLRMITPSGVINVLAQSRDLRDDPDVQGVVLSLRPQTDPTPIVPSQEHRDPLTGLVNRAGAFTWLDEHLLNEQQVSVFFCDLDGFKTINDTLGHKTGDVVLRRVARRLLDNLPSTDVVARLGGDEFLILSSSVRTQVDAEDRVQRIIRACTPPLVVDDAEVSVGVSVGVALPRPGMTAEGLIWAADVAMYEAKRLRSGYVLFTDSLHDAARNRSELEQDLRKALTNGQMRLVYQPILSLQTGRIVGCEALLRWLHPQRGEVSPAIFVPIAEQVGLIDDLGGFALRTALAQQRTWMNTHRDHASKFMAVNISAHQLTRPGFVSLVRDALRSAGVPADRLTLEITESALLADAEAASVTLSDLAELGVSLDIDDFGTGYSNLAYLVRLPVHALKIDKSFIWGLGEDDRMDTTVRALLGLARQLGLRTIAEGVETAAQLAWLRENNCDMVQGFHVSQAVEPDIYEAVSDSCWF